jgi:hypothetical protein
MAADLYCAICGAALGNPDLSPGSNSDRTRRKRKEVIEHGLRVRAGQIRGKFSSRKSELDISDLEHNHNIEHKYDSEVMACRDTTLPNHDRSIGHVRLVMNSSLLNPEVLYRVMRDNLHGGINREDRYLFAMGYGDITTGEQYWEYEAGEEVSISRSHFLRRV